jgi:hypothetical protein
VVASIAPFGRFSAECQDNPLILSTQHSALSTQS